MAHPHQNQNPTTEIIPKAYNYGGQLWFRPFVPGHIHTVVTQRPRSKRHQRGRPFVHPSHTPHYAPPTYTPPMMDPTAMQHLANQTAMHQFVMEQARQQTEILKRIEQRLSQSPVVDPELIHTILSQQHAHAHTESSQTETHDQACSTLNNEQPEASATESTSSAEPNHNAPTKTPKKKRSKKKHTLTPPVHILQRPPEVVESEKSPKEMEDWVSVTKGAKPKINVSPSVIQSCLQEPMSLPSANQDGVPLHNPKQDTPKLNSKKKQMKKSSLPAKKKKQVKLDVQDIDSWLDQQTQKNELAKKRLEQQTIPLMQALKTPSPLLELVNKDEELLQQFFGLETSVALVDGEWQIEVGEFDMGDVVNKVCTNLYSVLSAMTRNKMYLSLDPEIDQQTLEARFPSFNTYEVNVPSDPYAQNKRLSKWCLDFLSLHRKPEDATTETILAFVTQSLRLQHACSRNCVLSLNKFRSKASMEPGAVNVVVCFDGKAISHYTYNR